jgi:DnaJ-class molecular chaperone
MHPLEALKILGLTECEDLTTDEVKKAYRSEALKHHPDKGGDVKKFSLAKRAYDKLMSNIKHAKQFVGKKKGFVETAAGEVIETVNWSEIFSKGGNWQATRYTVNKNDTTTGG